MKKLTLRTAKIKNMFERFHQKLGGDLRVDFNEHILTIDNELGRGYIKGIKLEDEISYLEFDMEFFEDFTLICDSLNNTPICFAYCVLGSMAHSFGKDGKKRKLENFQTAILTSRAYEDHILHFEQDVCLKTTFIIVNPAENIADKNTLNHKLQKFLFKEDVAENFVYIGSYNLKIAEKIQQLNTVSQKGIVRNYLLLGLAHMILALEIEQHSEDLKKAANKTGSLTAREMDSVRELSQFIMNYPERQLSVSDLGRKGGLSPSKLQEGFKLMHGTTVTDHIRDIRVQKAEDLIKNTDLNISEVVYSIGFTSRSYFSKIFKAKYNCSPKQYKDNQNLLAV